MRRLFTYLFILLLLSIPGFAKKKNRPLEITSPNGQLKIQFLLKNGSPYYTVDFQNKLLVKESKLGFILKGLPSLSQDFKILHSKKSSFDETWTQPWGEVKTIRNHYNKIIVTLQEKTSVARKLVVEFRVYDEGVGFRYEIPEQPNLKDFVIMDELTEFALTQDFSSWWIPAYGTEMDSEYLYKHTRLTEIKEKVTTPITFESKDNLFVSIHEAALIDYAGMALSNEGDFKLKCDLVAWSDGDRVKTSAPMKTPWRTIQVANSPGHLVTSYLILNLNEPNKLSDVSWIKPGKYNGIWWGMHLTKNTWEGGPNHGATTENVKRLIDFASKHKLSAVLAEGWNEGWEGDWTVSGNFNFTKPYPDFDLAELGRYAREKNIGLIAHHETGGNVKNYERQLEDAFKLCERYDIHRLKTGYVNKLPSGERHQGQFMVRHYHKVMETAARYKIMLDVHEPIKDTGLRRTYPNMMTREGVRGTEYEAWSDGNPPSHTTILPFTRGLAGPIDYTPGIFDIQFPTKSTFRVHTTLAKQLALYVVIYSPMHMAADLIENYEGNPAFKFIEDVPTDWEETKILDATIGQHITTIRKDRNSADWYVGSITNDEGRIISIKLDFLTAGRKYKAELYHDARDAHVDTNPLAIEIKTREVTAVDTIEIKLAPGGGAAIRLHEIN